MDGIRSLKQDSREVFVSDVIQVAACHRRIVSPCLFNRDTRDKQLTTLVLLFSVFC